MRLAGLPDLGVLLGPDLTVRDVAMDRSAAIEGHPFQQGDRLIAIGGMTVDELRDLRAVLPPLMSTTEPSEFDDGELAESDVVLLDYQLWRPVHLYSLVMQGDVVDPTALPPGYEPDDLLVELDGRLLSGEQGPEGIRSIMASRPDAVLGFKRPNAVLSGQVKVDPPTNNPGVILAFALVLIAIVVMWRWHSESVGPGPAYCVALESLCLGWLFLLVFGFQWVLADYVLAAGVIAGLIMMRPLAIFAREMGDRNGGNGGTIALAIGLISTIGIIALMKGGYLSGPEESLHAAAILAGLFIIYELAASGFERDSWATMGERGGYLSGVAGLGLFVCLGAAVMDPVAFQEDRWRWFAVLLPTLVWFGDVLYVIKYGAGSAMGEVADRGSRRKLIRGYFREIALEMPHTELLIVGQVDGRTMAARRDKHGVSIETVSDALADAVDILIRENARVPLPEGVDRMTHPMEGIAKAMHISIALPLVSPVGSLSLETNQVDLALVGMRESRDGDIPGYASTETLDLAQELWTGPVASAAVIEILSGLFATGDIAPMDGSVNGAGEIRRELEEAKVAAAQREVELESIENERDDVKESLARKELQVRLHQVAFRPDFPPISWEEELLEPELIEGLRYLVQGEEPIVFGGPVGAGKGFAAYRAHLLDGRQPDQFLMIDTAGPESTKAIDLVLGESGGGLGPGLLSDFEGSLLIRGSQRCNDPRMLALCHQTEEKGVRLFLSFESSQAEERSVLEDLPVVLQELLGHREVIIPRFGRRRGIFRPVLQFWLAEWAFRYGKPVDGFSRMAMEALEAYHYPGEVAEAVEVVRLAVLDTEHDVVDRENLPLRVREATLI